MRATLLVTLLLAGIFGTASAQTPPKPNPSSVPYKLPADLTWTKEATYGYYTTTLFGDPAKPGLYGILIKWPPNTFSTPHFHSSDRHIYVVSGTWWVSDSTHYDPAQTYPLPAGSFATDLAGKVHWDGAKDQETIIELVGMGPVATTRLPVN
jgi:quercetin dioxygenase-like cupin family protein